MPELVQSEIRRLWDLLPRPSGTFVRWFARAGNVRIGGGVDCVEELILAAMSTEGSMNFYVAPNPANTRAGTRHRTSDVSHWSWFLVDIDPVQKLAEPEFAMSEVLRLLSNWWGVDFGKQRPVVIHSGRGIQIWIRLSDEPFALYLDGNDFRRRVRIANGFWLKRLADEIGELCGCRIDTTCADLPRVMRCPGTVNLKTGRNAMFLVPSGEVFEGLAELMYEGVPAQLFKPTPVPVLPAGTPWQNVLVHLTIRAQDYLTKGKDEPGRHDTMFHAALCLAERGLERDEVRRALEYGNKRWDLYHTQPLAEGAESMALRPEDIEHALDTAFRRLRETQETGTLEVEGEPTTTEGGS